MPGGLVPASTDDGEPTYGGPAEGDASQALILPAKKKGQRGSNADVRKQKQAEVPQLSKSQERKLRKLQEDKIKRERRGQLLESLAKTELPPDALALLSHSGALGSSASAREQLQQQLKLERAGLDATAVATTVSGGKPGAKVASLYKPVKPSHPTSMDEDDDEEELRVAGPAAGGGAVDGAGRKAGQATVVTTCKRARDEPAAPVASKPQTSTSSNTKAKPSASAAAAAPLPSKRVKWAEEVTGGFGSSDDDEEDEDEDDEEQEEEEQDEAALADAEIYQDDEEDDSAPVDNDEAGSDDSSDVDLDEEDSSDDDNDDEEDDDEEEDDDDEEEEMDDGAARPSRRRGRVTSSTSSSAPAHIKPSAFAFSINVGGGGAAVGGASGSAAAGSSSGGFSISLPSSSSTAAATSAPAASSSSASAVDASARSIAMSVGLSSKADPMEARLAELRKRNEEEAARRAEREARRKARKGQGRSGSSDEEDEDGGRKAAASHEDVVAATTGAMRGHSAYTSADWSSDEEDEDEDGHAADGKAKGKGKQPKKRRTNEDGRLAPEELAAARAALARGEDTSSLDPVALRAALWSTDGSRIVGSASRLPDSAYSAYGRTGVVFNRSQATVEARQELPVTRAESEVMEAVALNDVLLLAGETGSGKTTQVPQFLLEAGYGLPRDQLKASTGAASAATASGKAKANVAASSSSSSSTPVVPEALYRGVPGMVAVTQPRRVAATAMAARVAAEIGGPGPAGRLGHPSCVVGYQVRYDKASVHAGTRLKFMTDGVLLREVSSDILLRQYSVIVIDEAHERGANTDVLLGLLSRAVPLRNAIARRHAEELRVRIASGQALPAPDSDEAPLGPLKLIIMSATLRLTDFTGNRVLFPSPPPVVRVEARQHPVTTHFARKTELLDYVGAAYDKACKIHTSLPDGGLLVFVTSAEEVEQLVSRLKARFDTKRRDKERAKRRRIAEAAAAAAAAKEGVSAAAAPVPASKTPESSAKPAGKAGTSSATPADKDGWGFGSTAAPSSGQKATGRGTSAGAGQSDDGMGQEDDSSEVDHSHDQAADAEDAVKRKGAKGKGPGTAAAATTSVETNGVLDDEDQEGKPDHRADKDADDDWRPVHVLPLYALLPRASQDKVFAPPPPGHRLIVVATNVAETSLTIPGIRYVIDCGRVKRRMFDPRSGASRFVVGWTSRASADQRAGRAGRTGPGHAYRLYSSAVYAETMPAHEEPEVCRMPAESLVLHMKALGIASTTQFPFPTPPARGTLQAAVRSLTNLGALEAPGKGSAGAPNGATTKPAAPARGPAGEEGHITTLGKVLSRLPIHPSLGKLLALAWQQQKAARAAGEESHPAWNLLEYAVLLAASLGQGESPLYLPPMPSRLPGKGKGKGAKGPANSAAEAAKAGSSTSATTTNDDDDISVAGSEDMDAQLLAEAEAEEEQERLKRGDKDEEDGAAVADRKEAAALELERQKRLEERNAAHAAHARLRHPLSDALTVLRAAGAYVYSVASADPGDRRGAASRFCKAQYLRKKAMEEVVALAVQLRGIVRDVLGPTHEGEVTAVGPKEQGKGSTIAGAGDVQEDAEETSTVTASVAAASLADDFTSGLEDNDGGLSVVGPGSVGNGTTGRSTLSLFAGRDDTEIAAGREEPAEDGADGVDGEAGGHKASGKARGPRPYPLPILPPPSVACESLLRQLLTAGLLERVARRATMAEAVELNAAVGLPPPGTHGRGWVPYVPACTALSPSAMVQGLVELLQGDGTDGKEAGMTSTPTALYIHPGSGLVPTGKDCLSTAPATIVFNEVVVSAPRAGGHGAQGDRPPRAYIRNVTAVDETWLYALGTGTPLVSLGPALASPLPRYDVATDAVVSFAQPAFGDKGWKLSPVPIPFRTTTPEQMEQAVRLFGRALLECSPVPGPVPGLRPFAPSFAKMAQTVGITRGDPSTRVALLVDALRRPPAMRRPGTGGSGLTMERPWPVTSASSLTRMWAGLPGYLLTEIGEWLREADGATTPCGNGARPGAANREWLSAANDGRLTRGDLTAAWPGIVAGFLRAHGVTQAGGK